MTSYLPFEPWRNFTPSVSSFDDVKEAVENLRGGKEGGKYNISAELLETGDEAMIGGLLTVFTTVWHSAIIPPDRKKGMIIPIWIEKGKRQDYKYHIIALLSVEGKVLGHLLFMQIHSHLLKYQRPEPFGFMPRNSITYYILTLRILVVWRRDFWQGMLVSYVYLKKGCDSVHRETLWWSFMYLWDYARFSDLLSVLYTGNLSVVKCWESVSNFFPLKWCRDVCHEDLKSFGLQVFLARD